MKKNGFTLAEVLITLAIIGVVATLTLPALMTNTAEQQAKTALKKGINTMTEAVQMNQAIEGFDYSSLSSQDTSNEDERSLYGILAKRTNLDYAKTLKQGSAEVVDVLGGSSNFAVFLRDGAAVIFNPGETLKSVDKVKALESDGLVHGVSVIYDTNGTKGPNILSNCDGNATLTMKTDYSDKDKTCTKDKRVIKDQFGMRLRGDYVVPNGPAARWAFEN